MNASDSEINECERASGNCNRFLSLYSQLLEVDQDVPNHKETDVGPPWDKPKEGLVGSSGARTKTREGALGLIVRPSASSYSRKTQFMRDQENDSEEIVPAWTNIRSFMMWHMNSKRK